jgi:hypothetical protein
MPKPAAELRQIERKRREDLKELFTGGGYYEELKQAINQYDSSLIATIAQKQFAQLHDPSKQANFLCGFARHLPDVAAKDSWFKELLPLIPIMKAHSQRQKAHSQRQNVSTISNAHGRSVGPEGQEDFDHSDDYCMVTYRDKSTP